MSSTHLGDVRDKRPSQEGRAPREHNLQSIDTVEPANTDGLQSVLRGSVQSRRDEIGAHPSSRLMGRMGPTRPESAPTSREVSENVLGRTVSDAAVGSKPTPMSYEVSRDMVQQAEAEIALWAEQLAAADDYADIRRGGVLALVAPGSHTKRNLEAIQEWIEGRDPSTGELDPQGWQATKAFAGAFAMLPAVLYGGLQDYASTVGQIVESATGHFPEGRFWDDETTEAVRTRLEELQRFAEAAQEAAPPPNVSGLGDDG